jgi:mRNA interferase MazF
MAEIGRKRRPVLVLSRSEVIGVRALVTVAEVTTTIRHIAAEVEFDHKEAGLDRPSVINCDGLHTISKASLTTYAGAVGEGTMERVCSAIGYALGC